MQIHLCTWKADSNNVIFCHVFDVVRIDSFQWSALMPLSSLTKDAPEIIMKLEFSPREMVNSSGKLTPSVLDLLCVSFYFHSSPFSSSQNIPGFIKCKAYRITEDIDIISKVILLDNWQLIINYLLHLKNHVSPVR